MNACKFGAWAPNLHANSARGRRFSNEPSPAAACLQPRRYPPSRCTGIHLLIAVVLQPWHMGWRGCRMERIRTGGQVRTIATGWKSCRRRRRPGTLLGLLGPTRAGAIVTITRRTQESVSRALATPMLSAACITAKSTRWRRNAASGRITQLHALTATACTGRRSDAERWCNASPDAHSISLLAIRKKPAGSLRTWNRYGRMRAPRWRPPPLVLGLSRSARAPPRPPQCRAVRRGWFALR